MVYIGASRALFRIELLKIERLESNGAVVFELSGRIEMGHVTELQKMFEQDAEVRDIAIDLNEVKLVDREAVKFLAACEGRGIVLKNCPPYVRQWILYREGIHNDLG